MPDSDEDDDDYREYDEGEEGEAFLEDFDDLAIGSRRKIFGENGDDRFDDDEEDAARSGLVTPQVVRFLSLSTTRSHPLLISSALHANRLLLHCCCARPHRWHQLFCRISYRLIQLPLHCLIVPTSFGRPRIGLNCARSLE